MKWRIEIDSVGKIKVPSDRLWGAQTERSRHYFSIGQDRMPKELIRAYALLKKGAAIANGKQKRLSSEKVRWICRICEEILAGKHDEEFPLHVWMTGSGTQFNMNVNEVISNRCSQMTKHPLGSKVPLHPNDDVNLSQSSNDTFPTAMHIAAALAMQKRCLPQLKILQKGIAKKGREWKGIVKLGRTHLQDATPMTLGQEFSGYGALLEDQIRHLEESLRALFSLAIGGTAIGTGVGTYEGFDRLCAAEIGKLTRLPFVPAKNKFAAQGSHAAMTQLSAALRNTAAALYKIANDLRFLSCGPRSGISELILPSNEPGSSIMPGKVNPTQCEALAMVCVQVIANDSAVCWGDAGGQLEMNVYKPLIIKNILHSIEILSDACGNFEKFLIRDCKPNREKTKKDVEHSLMLVTALTPLIGYDKCAAIAHHAMKHNLSLKKAALQLGYVSEEEFDKWIQPLAMCHPKKPNM